MTTDNDGRNQAETAGWDRVRNVIGVILVAVIAYKMGIAHARSEKTRSDYEALKAQYERIDAQYTKMTAEYDQAVSQYSVMKTQCDGTVAQYAALKTQYDRIEAQRTRQK
jgi:CO dehydrogenase/acetyl-CoA synthase delta subunit